MSTVALWLKRGFIGARSFTPGRLFAANEQGAWYDPSDFSTLFQDDLGTTPVTAVEQTVGLMLDKSRGTIFDANVVNNGSFDANLTGWTLTQTVGASLPVWSAGALKLVSDGTGFSRADQQLTVVSGQAYRVTLSLTHPGVGSADLTVGTSQGGSDLLSSQNLTLTGTFTYTFVASGTTAWIRLSTGSSNATGYLLDNVVVRTATEMVSDWDFNTPASWTPETADWVVSGGKATYTKPATNVQYLQSNENISIVSGNWYRVTFTLSGIASGSAIFSLFNKAATVNYFGGYQTYTANGTYSICFLASSSTTGIRIYGNASGSATSWSLESFGIKPLPGNHAFQATAASRPTLRAKYNLLTRTEEFADAVWNKQDLSVTNNVAVAPDGTTTADRLVEGTGTLQKWVWQGTGAPNVTHVGSVYLKADTRFNARVIIYNNGSDFYGVVVNLTNGTTSIREGGTRSNTASSVTNVGNGWWRVAVQAAIPQAGGGGTTQLWINVLDDVQAENYNGNGTSGILVWGAQLLTAADQTATGGAYQRVGSATDYATGGLFRPYLAFDGVDDSMSTNSVDFTTVTSDGLPRRNLFSNPTQLDDAAAWPKLNALVTGNATTAPDGTTAADTFSNLAAGGVGYHYVYQAPTLLQNGTYTISAWVKHKTGSGWIWLLGETSSDAFCYFNVLTGVVGQTTGFANVTIQSAGNGWYRCSATFTKTTATTTEQIAIGLSQANSIPNWDSTGLANTQEVFVWGMQLETGSTLTGFQNIGTDRMSVFAGLHKASDAARGLLLELGPGGDGRIIIQAPDGPGSNLVTYTARGTIDVGAASPAAAPSTRVFTGLNDISADSVRLRLNGAQVDQNSSDMGVGNHANGALNIGNRQGGTLFFNGRLYALAVLGRTATPAEIAATEAWVNSKTGAY